MTHAPAIALVLLALFVGQYIRWVRWRCGERREGGGR